MITLEVSTDMSTPFTQHNSVYLRDFLSPVLRSVGPLRPNWVLDELDNAPGELDGMTPDSARLADSILSLLQNAGDDLMDNGLAGFHLQAHELDGMPTHDTVKPTILLRGTLDDGDWVEFEITNLPDRQLLVICRRGGDIVACQTVPDINFSADVLEGVGLEQLMPVVPHLDQLLTQTHEMLDLLIDSHGVG